jgi:hypothetical protein
VFQSTRRGYRHPGTCRIVGARCASAGEQFIICELGASFVTALHLFRYNVEKSSGLRMFSCEHLRSFMEL